MDSRIARAVILWFQAWILVAAGPALAQENQEGSSLKLELAPVLEYRTVDGDEDKFREDWWMREGWAGGLERFETKRFEETQDLGSGASEGVEVAESYEHDALVNTLHLESRLTDTVYVSLGWLLNDLEGEGTFDMMTVPFGPEPFDKNWKADNITLDQESHVLNLNAKAGPYRKVSIHGGIQADFTEIEGETRAVLTETLPGVGPASPEARILSRSDQDGLEETLGLRYSGIPHTSLFADARWIQKGIDLFERETEYAAVAFERLTDTAVDRSRYTLGFSTSPIRRLTFSGRYRPFLQQTY